MEIHNTSDSIVEFLHGQEIAYFDARSKGLVQINNSKHFPIDQYFHDRMTPATLSPSPLAYEKLIHPAEIARSFFFYGLQFGGVVLFCCFFVCIKLLGNVVRVYPKIVQDLTFLSA